MKTFDFWCLCYSQQYSIQLFFIAKWRKKNTKTHAKMMTETDENYELRGYFEWGLMHRRIEFANLAIMHYECSDDTFNWNWFSKIVKKVSKIIIWKQKSGVSWDSWENHHENSCCLFIIKSQTNGTRVQSSLAHLFDHVHVSGQLHAGPTHIHCIFRRNILSNRPLCEVNTYCSSASYYVWRILTFSPWTLTDSCIFLFFVVVKLATFFRVELTVFWWAFLASC